jgi:uncharacterized membrane protein
MDVISVVIITIFAAMLVSIAQYLFKRNMSAFRMNRREILGIIRNRAIVAGILIYIASFGVYLVALKSGELSYVYPIFSSAFVFVTLISIFTLKEKVNAFRILGILLVVAGIAIVASNLSM